MKQKKIAFIHYSHHPNESRLETMPFSLNSILSLVRMDWKIDLYLWEEPGVDYNNLFPPNTVTIKYFKDPNIGPSSSRNLLRPMQLNFQFQWRNHNYCCVFGLGQIGAYLADIIAQSNKCPLIYFNDEFPSTWGETLWTKLEKQAVKNASLIVVPDPHRFHPLSQELDISTKPHVFLPNIPIIKPPFEEIDWHEKLAIPKNCIPFLHAGSVTDWSQVPEILSSLPYWHEQAVLILHNRSREPYSRKDKYRRELSHLDIPGKVIWSYESLSESSLHSLVSYVAGNFALYRNIDSNMQYMGFSSGKLMRSLACGCPVIASKLPSLAFIKDYQLGVLVNHPSEIPAAVEEIMFNRKAYSNRCLDFCRTNVSFEKAWQTFYEQFKQIVNAD